MKCLPLFWRHVICHAKRRLFEKVSLERCVESVQMLKCSLEKLQQVLELHGYDALNLLSCMTLDVENIHSVVHHKDPLCTGLDYARNFTNAAKEDLERTTHWAVIYLLQIHSLGILCPNVPCFCWPCLLYNPC